MAIYCMQCGKELPDDANFCLKCGKSLKASSVGKTSPTSSPLKLLFGIPLEVDEREIYQAEIKSKDQYILTNRQIIVGRPKSWLSKEEVIHQIPFSKISTVRTVREYFDWVVQIEFNNISPSPWISGSASICCNNQQQAVELAVKIREVM